MTASVLTVTSAIASKTITTGFFISALALQRPAEPRRPEFSWVQNEPTVHQTTEIWLGSAKGRRGDTIQRRNVMLTIRMLAAAIIRISEPSKLLKTRNIGTLAVPEHPLLS
jgi:hypothetical protein